MAATRTIASAMQTAITGSLVYPGLLVYMDFTSGAVRVWNGYGDLSWDSQTWLGVGNLGEIGEITETEQIRANGTTLTLNGIPTEIANLFLGERYWGREVSIWFAAFSSGAAIVADPVKIFSGRMDNADITEAGETAAITVYCESRLADLQRPRNRRRTHQDQQIDYPGDDGFEYTASLMEADLYWGRPGRSPIFQ